MLGTVSWFNEQKGFGFIQGDDGQKYFVHYSAIDDKGFKVLHEGDKVDFASGKNAKGNNAEKVKKVL